ncbi:hypothetical protein AXF42_Ash012000 [Apostasia shenzhenica]|uniref:Uncharacterized protein n=1 Tax=Apostasia shenzhenica TaxID=1088818 RepID=A0A2I0AJJ2_9ASPA|nr:hypothetical protein AXF42_Ash012000 [Apostasia shenzhenica]
MNLIKKLSGHLMYMHLIGENVQWPIDEKRLTEMDSHTRRRLLEVHMNYPQ